MNGTVVMSAFSSTLVTAATAVANLGCDALAIGMLDDDALLAGHTTYVALTRQVETHGAWIAGEIARRSQFSPGSPGLARTRGFRTPGGLIQAGSGSTAADADKLMKIGIMLAEAAAAASIAAALEAEEAARAAADRAAAAGCPKPEPLPFNPLVLVAPSPDALWQAPLVKEVAAGTLSTAQADSLRSGLGTIGAGITAAMLLAAVEDILSAPLRGAASSLYRRARQHRERLDSAGVARKEIEQRSLQYFAAKRRADGMVTGSFAFSGVDGALLLAICENAVAPHTVDPDIPALDDSRSPGLKAADHVINLIQVGLDADAGTVAGTRRPSVRLVVEKTVLTAREADPAGPADAGSGYIQETLDAVSLAVVEAALCNTGMLGIQFDSTGQCVDVGRDKRLFTPRQKVGLAIRDAGCMGPGCGKPPSWTEAHHINYWGRDKGRTDIALGILLCRYHHMLFHNDGWEIHRIDNRYWLQPPKKIDPKQRLILMVSNSPLIREMIAKNKLLAKLRNPPPPLDVGVLEPVEVQLDASPDDPPQIMPVHPQLAIEPPAEPQQPTIF